MPNKFVAAVTIDSPIIFDFSYIFSAEGIVYSDMRVLTHFNGWRHWLD